MRAAARKVRIVGFMLMAVALAVAADGPADFSPAKKPSVSVAPIEPVAVKPGAQSKVEIAFRVADGFHINSNKPTGESLVPTALKFDPPTDIVISRLSYPPGQEFQFDFAPGEKLNVYSGDFRVTAYVSAAKSIPTGTYRVRGTLKYQACDNRACFPPMQMPLAFDVNVKKASRARHNPGQSPHVHR